MLISSITKISNNDNDYFQLFLSALVFSKIIVVAFFLSLFYCIRFD